MVSLSTTTPLFPFTSQNASTRIPPPNSFSYSKQLDRDQRKVVCACIAPPQNFKSQDSSHINFNVNVHKLISLFCFTNQILLLGLVLSESGVLGNQKVLFFFLLMGIWLTSRLLPGFAQIRTAERGAGSR